MCNNICKAPFFTAEVFGNGSVYCCCPSYLKIGSIGNIYEQTWDEVWNSDIAVQFRNKIKNSDYSSCYVNFCDPQFFPLCHELKYVDPNKLDLNNPKARVVKLSMDDSCNVACTICRKKIRCNLPNVTEFLDSKIETILCTLQDAEIVNFTGTGDPFASKHVRKIIKIINETYPDIRFNFHTNGILCDERNLSELGVIDKLSTVEISLHSATKETYDKIVKNGNWERVNKNLEFLSDLLAKGKLNEIQLNFVVLSENYKAIPDFIALCKKYNAKAFIWQYRDWGSGVYDYNSVDVAYPLHKNHKEFIKILSQIDGNDPDIFMTPLLRKYTKIKNVDEYNFYASMFAAQNAERYESKGGFFIPKFRQIEQNRVEIDQIKNQLSHISKEHHHRSAWEKIFSVRNEYKNDVKRKVISILGVKFKFKMKPKDKVYIECHKGECDKQIISTLKNNVRKQSVLIAEPNFYHAEIIPGYAKYFFDLGYTVDVLMIKENYNGNSLCRINDKRIHVYIMNLCTMKHVLQNKKLIDNYDVIFLNSSRVFPANSTSVDINRYLGKILGSEKTIIVAHQAWSLLANKKYISLAKNCMNTPVVNPNYFGEVKITPKNDKTVFLISGDGTKEFSFVFEAVKQLIDNGISNFVIYITGRRKHPYMNSESNKNIHDYIKWLGFIPFNELYNLVEEADYIISCLDPQNSAQEKYFIKDATSGAFQLCYGFLKPMLIASKFAYKAHANSSNSIIYRNNSDLTDAIKYAIDLSKDDYKTMQENLKLTVEKINEDSLKTLQTILDEIKNAK